MMSAGGGFDEAALRTTLAGKRVLLTGHSGFKGGWMALWLKRLGATVVGISLPPQSPSFHDAVRLGDQIDGRVGDIRAPECFAEALGSTQADAVVHMAAQAIVRQSHMDPVNSYLTNVVGTAVVLDAARAMPGLKAIVVVTSDKCYENREWTWGYRETDELGGHDPYSSSKACTELVASAYRRSFFSSPESPLLATVRAGNVFGGGDWAADRLVPDIVRAALEGRPTFIRNPGSVRPWQHVLEPLSGYLMLLAALLRGEPVGEAWNFGPDPQAVTDVETLARLMAAAWGPGGPAFRFGKPDPHAPHEAGTLALDSGKARARLGWAPRLSLQDAVGMTVDWYRRHAAQGTDMAGPGMADFSLAQIEAFANRTADEQGELQKCA